MFIYVELAFLDVSDEFEKFNFIPFEIECE